MSKNKLTPIGQMEYIDTVGENDEWTFTCIQNIFEPYDLLSLVRAFCDCAGQELTHYEDMPIDQAEAYLKELKDKNIIATDHTSNGEGA